MADYHAVSAVGQSLTRLLNMSFDETLPLGPTSRVKSALLRSEEMEPASRSNEMSNPLISLFLYRVDINPHTRAAWSSVSHQTGKVHLPLDLYYLLTPWAANAEFEYRMLGHAMECLERNPILAGPLLYPSANWSGHETVQVCSPQMSTEDLMRIFDSLPVDYKLSVPYMARVVRVDANEIKVDPPVHHSIVGSKSGVTV